MDQKTKDNLKYYEIVSQQDFLKNGYISILLLTVIVVIVGLLTILVDHSKGIVNAAKLIIYIFPAIIYGISSWYSRKEKIDSKGYLILMIFYLAATIMELLLGYTPRKILRSMSMSGTGVVHEGTLIMEFIPYIYALFRILLSIVFLRLFIAKFKVEKYYENKPRS